MSGLTREIVHAILFAVALCASLAVSYAILAVLKPVVERIPGHAAACLLKRLREPALVLAPLTTILAALPWAQFDPEVEAWLYHATTLLLILSLGWTAIRFYDAWRDTVALHHRLDIADNLRARQVMTQVLILRRITLVIVILVTLAAMLMTFPQVRAVGATLFASAGAAGLLMGLAARPVLTNVIAGLQVALTEPIRIEDVVIVEGEWGWIEEIRTTYVVVRIWDQRRLVVPLSYFIEKPFQNWTRRTADLLGTVVIYADYTVPAQALRDELHAILKATPLWDGKAWALQMTDATPQTVELRILVSAADSGKQWDLRCLVREKLIDYLQKHYPQCLPQTRVLLPEERPDAPGATSGETA